MTTWTRVFIVLAILFLAAPAIASSVDLAWTAPTQNEDGTLLTDLAGYTVYGGLQPGLYNVTWDVADPDAVTTTVTFTASEGDRWYFAMTALDLTGNESAFSHEVNQYFPTQADMNVPAAPGALTITGVVQ